MVIIRYTLKFTVKIQLLLTTVRETNMNKQQLIKTIADTLDTTQKGGREALDAVFGAIQQGLVEDGKVSVVGFGNFMVRNKNSRIGRNPQTGVTIKVPAKKSPAFKPSQKLKKLVND